MHLITRKTLRAFWQQHPDSKTALERWSKIIERNNFDSFTQLRETFPSADLVGTLDSSFKSRKAFPKGLANASAASNPPNGMSRKLTVFNIGGNKYRLIAAIHFNRHKVYIRHILTHAEYDKDNWKL